MKKIFIQLSLLIIVSLTSCGIIAKKAEGPVIEKQLYLDAFESIDVKGSMNVFVTYGEDVEVRVTGEEDAVNALKTTVSGKNWAIQFDRLFSDHSVKIYITTPFLNKVSISSSGDLDIDKIIQPNFSVSSSSSGQIRVNDVSEVNNELNIKTSSSGDVEIQHVNALKVTTALSSSGSISLDGNATSISGALSSSGRLNAERLKVSYANFSISSSGSAYIHATKTLIGQLSSSGSLYYKGSPSFDVKTSSSGTLKKMD
ncbi:head GIN domain-containing protein [Flammeovirga pacifica]|uniref:Putative auto-transporter adhesin head GIN domain-containing protein n=1 Tax=Flammeovirga pacifica TaxID=915059 RepID=A0A1S1Z4Y6_FLAPC|nr:head GIN domain-containing protein [Flammeovirga pacifica]OHX68292.1 hypothetical protein NH26_19035 [Flammeovirga pacifica]